MGSRRLVMSLAMASALTAGLALATSRQATADGDPPLPPPDDMGHNGLSSASLFHNALTLNPKALGILLKSPLNDSTLNDPYLKDQLLDPAARDVMTDLLACALRPPQTGAPRPEFAGELGLCTKEPDDWRAHPPTQRCLQLVTACLLARVNALSRRVPVSFRAPGGMLPTRSHVLVEKNLRESAPNQGLSLGTPIASLAGPPCPNGGDCDWQAGYIGRCAGSLQNPPTLIIHGDTTCNASIRVCRGIYGCEGDKASVKPQSAQDYSGPVVPTASGACAVSFSCPFQGVYGIMLRSAGGNLVASSGTYAASEPDVFRYREAAFFGTLFEPKGLTTPEGLTRTREVTIRADHKPQIVEVTIGMDGQRLAQEVTVGNDSGRTKEFTTWRDGVPVTVPIPRDRPSPLATPLAIPYQNVYACYPDRGTQADLEIASLNDRVCANPDSKVKCFPHPIRSCSQDRCVTPRGERDYAACTGDVRASYVPITTYLDDPCSLLDQQQCDAVKHHLGAAVTVPGAGASR